MKLVYFVYLLLCLLLQMSDAKDEIVQEILQQMEDQKWTSG